jgi:hypothetical protein
MSSKGARKSQEMKATDAFQYIVKSVANTPHEEDENNESDVDEKARFAKEHMCERELPTGRTSETKT